MANIIHACENSWKLAGTATGTTEINLPDGWNEVQIDAVRSITSQGISQMITCTFIKKSKAANTDYLYFGSSAIEYSYIIDYEAGTLKLAYASVSNVSVTADVTSYIYYK